MQKRVVLMIVLFFEFIFLGGAALAQEVANDDEGKPLYEFGVGVSLLSIPEYRGADDSNNHVLPFPYIIYRGSFIKADGRSIRGILFSSDKIEIDLSFDASPPVKSRANGPREGMSDLDPTFELGPNITYQITDNKTDLGEIKLELKLSLRRVVATDIKNYAAHGWVIHPRLNFDYLSREGLFKDLNFGFSAGPLFGTAKYHGYYYDIDEENRTSSRATFKSGGGYGGTRLTGTLSKRFAQYWVGAFARTDFLGGASFEGSSLIKKRTSTMAGVGIAWIFYTSPAKVYK